MLSEDVEVRGYNAYMTQVENIIRYCEDNNLVDNLSDKDDKKYDRGKAFLKELPQMIGDVKRIRLDLLNIQEKTTLKSDVKFNSIISFLDGQGK